MDGVGRFVGVACQYFGSASSGGEEDNGLLQFAQSFDYGCHDAGFTGTGVTTKHECFLFFFGEDKLSEKVQ